MADAPDSQTKPVKPRRRLGAPGWLIIVAAGVVLLVAMVFLGVRYGAVTPAGRLVVEAQLNGVKIGRFGRLKVEGLRGDIWRNFMVARLTVTDEKGVWLDAREIAVQWHYTELIGRRFHADTIAARSLTLIRRPTLTPKGKSQNLPVSFRVDTLKARVEMLPAFSYRRGVYDLRTNFQVERDNSARGQIKADSALHAGDFLEATFDVPKDKAFLINADAREAQGGALAGALGLAADKPFLMIARAAGTTSEGHFSVETRVGEETPLEATGAWNKTGGMADGHIALTASRLLERWRARLGPEAAFHIEGAKAASGFYALALKADSQNVKLLARGEADIGRRITGPRGVAIDVTVGDSKPFLSWPPTAGVHLRGGLGVEPKRWVVAGQASVTHPDIGPYRLARLFGPVRITHQRGETVVNTTATGEGGTGTSVLAALLGARPHGSAELAFLADGRVLMRKLSAQGSGITAVGTGERTLFGGLAFKGDATVTNLAAAHAGAHGVVTGGWTAAQSSGGKPWAITFDAKAKDFAAGLGELDRLLGTTPHLRAVGDYQGGVFSVSSSHLEGTAGLLDSSGLIGSDGTLKLKLDWRAAGPFRIGPLEITGDAKGAGALTGTIANPRADLIADFDTIDLPYLPLQKAHVILSFMNGANDTNGTIVVAATSRYGASKGQAAFRFISGGVDLSNIDVSAGGAQAQGSLGLRRGEPSAADLTLAVGPGAFLAQGKAAGHVRLVDAPGGPRASLALEASNAALKSGGMAVRSLKLTAEGPLSRLPYELNAEGLTPSGPLKAHGSGIASEVGGDYAVSFEGTGTLRRADFRTLAPAEFRFGRSGAAAKLQLAVGGGRANVDYRNAGGAMNAKASLSDVSLGLLDEDFIGRFDADVSLAGTGSNLSGDLEARLQGAGGRDLKGAPPVDGLVKAHLAGGELRVDASLGNSAGLKAQA
ncbi:MAG TPA: translocation/assembly module TamB, partial [Caulobacteraceae bacterium]|nr:translocation/assembly module TamB [Caulobacteraceae bacterium]